MKILTILHQTRTRKTIIEGTRKGSGDVRTKVGVQKRNHAIAKSRLAEMEKKRKRRKIQMPQNVHCLPTLFSWAKSERR